MTDDGRRQRRLFWRCPGCGGLVPREDPACACGVSKEEWRRRHGQEPALRVKVAEPGGLSFPAWLYLGALLLSSLGFLWFASLD